jgi:L-alanine-DL-glutamate epimerase-like enolase superfamily enzyme
VTLESWDKTGSPYIDEITTGGWKLDRDGMMPIPDAPGLGIDHDAVARYSGGRSLLDG